jgi:hypothetical protein
MEDRREERGRRVRGGVRGVKRVRGDKGTRRREEGEG